MQGIIKMVNLMVKENISGQMVQLTQEILQMVRDKVQGNGDLVKLMQIFISDNIKKIKNLEKVNIFGQMVANFKEILLRTLKMGKAMLSTKTEEK